MPPGPLSSARPPATARRRRYAAAAASSDHPPPAGNDHSSEQPPAAAIRASTRGSTQAATAERKAKADEVLAKKAAREAKAEEKKAAASAAREAKAVASAARQAEVDGAAAAPTTAPAPAGEAKLPPRPPLQGLKLIVRLCRYMLQTVPCEDKDLPDTEKALHLSALHKRLDVLAAEDSSVAMAVEDLIDAGIIDPPSYEGVRPVALLLQTAMDSTGDYPELADLLTTPRLLAALDDLDFPLSAKRIKQEMASMSGLGALDERARVFALLDQWIQLLADRL